MKLLICGDYIVDKLENNHNDIFGEFIKIIKEADISIYNQEHPVTLSRKKYPTKKFGPTGACNPEALKPVLKAGFNCVSLANNHIFNRGIEGLNDTLDYFKRHNIRTIGAGVNLNSAQEIHYFNVDDITIAVLNFAENEFNTATKRHGGANPLNVIQNAKQIQEAKEKSDSVFVIIHGGIEYLRYPSPRMVQLCRFYVECGASAIVCHHSHVVSGYEVFKKSPIFYGIGNFIPIKYVNSIFKNEECLTTLPVLFNITKKEGVTFTYYPLIFNKKSYKLEFLAGKQLKLFLEDLLERSQFFDNEDLLKNKIQEEFLSLEKKAYYFTLFTHSNYNLYKAFRKLGLLSFYFRYINKKMKSDKRNFALWNLIRCETHNDVLNVIYENDIDTYSN